MNRLVKKTIIYSMVGIMQIGMFATVAEASALYNNGSGQIVQLKGDRHDRDNDRRRQHDDRKRHENERHEREMKRRPHESRREWRERQERERERHEHALREIAAFLIGIAIGSSHD